MEHSNNESKLRSWGIALVSLLGIWAFAWAFVTSAKLPKKLDDTVSTPVVYRAAPVVASGKVAELGYRLEATVICEVRTTQELAAVEDALRIVRACASEKVAVAAAKLRDNPLLAPRRYDHPMSGPNVFLKESLPPLPAGARYDEWSITWTEPPSPKTGKSSA